MIASTLDIAEIREVPNETTANQMIAQGWKLLKVLGATDADGDGYGIYVLGRPDGVPDFVKPKSELEELLESAHDED